jgi:hypothetical protein
MHRPTQVWSENLKGPLGRTRDRQKYNIKMNLTKYMRMWKKFVWLGTETNSGLL